MEAPPAQQLALRAEQLRHGPQQHDAEHTERQTGQGRHAHDHGKQPVGVFSVALAHRLADEGAAAGAEERKPTQPRIIRYGMMKFTAVNAALPAKFETKKPSVTQ